MHKDVATEDGKFVPGPSRSRKDYYRRRRAADVSVKEFFKRRKRFHKPKRFKRFDSEIDRLLRESL